MTYSGHVCNGLIKLDGSASLPEGIAVRVEPIEEQSSTTGESGGAIPTIWEKLLEIAGTVEGLPPDAAKNHDHYLYGAPKKP
jgi:hypothetical protein